MGVTNLYRLFIDTGAFIAIMDKNDSFHQEARSFYTNPDEDLKNKTHAVLKSYQDQDLSYADAASFVILETMNIEDVFGFDSHFYIINRNIWPTVAK